ncbi:hypothetical protein F5Y14DRAFT_98012 [Nemania sp. NC0429]|nr:hypothetical protein F5Y14DRAFT_98012 [Nemania sp. NC0429]
MSDAYLRTGRGGAGNFYSQKAVEDAVNKDKSEDLEAQKPAAHHPPGASPAHSAAPGVSRSGRGGAGNIGPSPTVLPSTSASASLPDDAAAAATTTVAPTMPGSKHTGRGGAGNWAEGESEGARTAKAEQDRRRREALDAGIAREIRASLPPPPRTYHLHQPGRGRKAEAEADNGGGGGLVDA